MENSWFVCHIAGSAQMRQRKYCPARHCLSDEHVQTFPGRNSLHNAVELITRYSQCISYYKSSRDDFQDMGIYDELYNTHLHLCRGEAYLDI